MNHRGSLSAGPVDRASQGPFCPAHSLTGRKLRHGVRGRQTGGPSGREPVVVAGHGYGRRRTPGYRHPLTGGYRRSPICVTPTTVSSRWVVHVVFSVVGPPSARVWNRPVTCAVRVRWRCPVVCSSGTAVVRFRTSAGAPPRTTTRGHGAGARFRPTVSPGPSSALTKQVVHSGEPAGPTCATTGAVLSRANQERPRPVRSRAAEGSAASLRPHRPGGEGLRPGVPAPTTDSGCSPGSASTGPDDPRSFVTKT
jgi:hypothetical protein